MVAARRRGGKGCLRLTVAGSYLKSRDTQSEVRSQWKGDVRQGLRMTKAAQVVVLLFKTTMALLPETRVVGER